MKKLVTVALMVMMIVGASSLTGCVGSNAVTGKLMQFNLNVVDNRYARGGVNFLLAPVYAITVFGDALIFNSIEFWAGRNPINGKPHIFDSKGDVMFEINDDLDPSLKSAPLKQFSKINSADKDVYSAKMKPINETTVEFHIVYTNGEKAVLRGIKSGSIVTFYMDGELVSTTTIAALETFVQSNS